MRTTIGWRQSFEHVHAVMARGPRLASLLAGIALLLAVAVAAPAAADEVTPTSTPRIEDGQPGVPEVEPAVAPSKYVPQVIGAPHLPRAERGKARVVQPSIDCPACDPVGSFVPEIFPTPLRIDNDWLPLSPGTQLVLQGKANRGGGMLPHTVTFSVTDLVKKINGIPCRVVWDRDVNQGVLSESELAFFAQDKDGNVWNSGEYPEEYEQGQFIGAENTWIHGVEWAQAGVPIRANPVLGTAGYLQAYAPENDFLDCGLVYAKARQTTCVPYHCYKDVVTIKEWAPWDGCDVIQLKTYARGVGVVEVGAINDPEGETLVLVEINQLNAQQMDSVRAEALKLDAHGYLVNEIYATTVPAYRAAHWVKPDGNHNNLSEGVTPHQNELLWAAPNPVTTSAGIAYSIAQAGQVEIAIFDVTGRRVRSLVNEAAAPGSYRVQWDRRDDGGNGVASGIYFARLRAGAQVVQKTLVVAK